jgi:WD40 repeat protein
MLRLGTYSGVVIFLAFAVEYPVSAGDPPGGATAVPIHNLDGHSSEIVSVAFSGSLRFWDIPPDKERAKIQAHKNGIYAIAMSPDGKFIASAGGDRLLLQLQEAPTALAISPNGAQLAFGNGEGKIEFWDLTPEVLKKITTP